MSLKVNLKTFYYIILFFSAFITTPGIPPPVQQHNRTFEYRYKQHSVRDSCVRTLGSSDLVVPVRKRSYAVFVHKFCLCLNHRMCLTNCHSSSHPQKIRISYLFNHLLQKPLYTLSLDWNAVSLHRDCNIYRNFTEDTRINRKETENWSVQEKGVIDILRKEFLFTYIRNRVFKVVTLLLKFLMHQTFFYFSKFYWDIRTVTSALNRFGLVFFNYVKLILLLGLNVTNRPKSYPSDTVPKWSKQTP